MRSGAEGFAHKEVLMRRLFAALGVCTLAVVGSYLGLFPQLRKLDKFPEPVITQG